MSIFEELNGAYPVRKTRAQKAAFREWALEKGRGFGWQGCEEKGGSSTNVVFGDPDTAACVFTAHYDTPPRMPFPNICTPASIFMFILAQGGIVLAMLAGAIILGAAIALATRNIEVSILISDAALLAFSALMMFGPANPSCANDNTSGTAAVLEIMSRIPESMRTKAAFVLFDNEEKGMLGSGAFKKKHPVVKNEKLLINMDCVGDGGYMFMLANKKTRALPLYGELTACLSAADGCELILHDMEKGIYPSDQSGFRFGVGVCACTKGRYMGYYFSKIHTAKDTVCEQRNLDFLACGIADFIEKI